MKKGTRNIKILDIEDAEKAYQKIFNLVLNGEIDNDIIDLSPNALTARTLFDIVDGVLAKK